MNTLDQLLDAIHNSTLTRDEEALLRCQAAYELEQAGDYEAAREHLKPFWPHFGERPLTNGLTDRAAAELLLRTGSLTGWLGQSRQLAGAQEIAKDIIGASAYLFRDLSLASKEAETQIELACCYFREAKFEESSAILENTLNSFSTLDSDLRAVTIMRLSNSKMELGLYQDSLRILTENQYLIDLSANHSVKGRFYTLLALCLRNLAPSAEQSSEFIDRALIYYAAAAYHFEEAGHVRYLAQVKNNIGFLLYKIGRFEEAQEHIEKAQKLSLQIDDALQSAVFDESLARLYLAQGRVQEAERIINRSISILEKGDNKITLVETLITQSIIASRFGDTNLIRTNFRKFLELTNLDSVLQLITKIAITPSDEAQLRCALAKEFEDRGEYDQARNVMGHLWRRVGEQPKIDNLDDSATAEVLLRAGVLTGYLGSARQIPGAQELAKDLITRSYSIFESLKAARKVLETQIEIGWCYFAQGSFREADAILSCLLEQLKDCEVEPIIVTAMRSAAAKRGLAKYQYALQILNNNKPFVDKCNNDILKGRYYCSLALTYRSLAASQKNPSEYLDSALIHYTEAAFYLDQAGSKNNLAITENNIGILLLLTNQFDEAEIHLNRSRNLFAQIKDSNGMAFADDSRARLLLAKGRVKEAYTLIKPAVNTLRKTEYHNFLSESLITQGIIQARLGNYDDSRKSFEEAAAVTEQSNDFVGVVRALISMLEELKDFLSTSELVAIYNRADQLLASSQATEERERLRKCATFVVAATTEGERDERDAEIVLESFERRLIPTSSPVLSGAQQCAVTEEPVLISGEYELGKKTLAHAMHKWSGRGGRFVSLSCAMLGEKPSLTLTKSFASAEAGTVLLENVEELDARAQGMIQRLVETGELHSTFTETAASRPRPRVIATTSRNLFEEVAQGRFSASLYYSLSTLEVDLSSFAELQLSEHLRNVERIRLFSKNKRVEVSKLTNTLEVLIILKLVLPLVYDNSRRFTATHR